jgi:hypothetical protein
MNATEARTARSLRLREAAAHGLRLVPRDPDPVAFPFVEWACAERPRRCGDCHAFACETRS